MIDKAYLSIKITASVLLASKQFQTLRRTIYHALCRRIKERIESDDFGIPLHLSHCARFIDQVDFRDQEIYRDDGFIAALAVSDD